ncbi:MAG: sugar phosphate nucleotidyltransferase [Vicinamibacterales bacterium]
MKAVILAGGLGTRMGDETASRPKPLVEVGGRPIIWHILKIYQAYGISDFVICAGYAGSLLTEYFARERGESWRVQVVDTGESTATGGRVKRVRELLGSEPFCMTYGDGVADVNVRTLLDFHRSHGKLVTVTAVRPWLPFGVITFPAEGVAVGFEEKPRLTDMWVNSGFFVIDPRAVDLVSGDDQAWENGPMATLAAQGQLAAYRHEGYWQCMDTPKDRQALEQAWASGQAPWKVW